MNQTYYEILNLPKYGINEYTNEPISEYEIIKAREKIVYGEKGIDISTRLKVDEAYRILIDSEKRKEYDEKLKQEININSFDVEIKEKETKEEVDEPYIEELKTEVVESKKIFNHPKVERNFELVPKTSITTFSELQTEETRLMEEYEEKLISQIYDLLNSSYNNYELGVALLKYQNQVELLKERIKFKENQKVTSSEYVGYCLSLLALRLRLKSAEKNLEKIKDYINSHNNTNQINHGLGKLYNKLDKTEQKLENKDTNMFYIKYLEIKKSKLLEKRENKINKMALHRKGIVSGVRIAIAYDITKTKVKNFIDSFKEEDENKMTR